MASSLSNLSNISLKEFMKLNVITDMIKKYKYKDCECCLEYANIKDDLIAYKCLC